MSDFIKKRNNSNSVGFWEPIPIMNIKTISSANKKIHAKSNDTLVTVNTDRDADGSLRKGVKSVLCSILEKDVIVIQQLTASPNPTVVIIDGMAVQG